MTFCFVFLAKDRGGVGIVSDRRISFKTGFDGWVAERDDATKIGLLTPNIGVVFAGNIRLVQSIIQGLETSNLGNKPSQRLEVLRASVTEHYIRAANEDKAFLARDQNAQFIFFDSYRRHGRHRYRLLRMHLFYCSSENRVHVACREGRKTVWAAIGASPDVRRHLSDRAANAMSEFASRRGTVRSLNPKEIDALRAKGKSHSLAEFVLDTTGGEPVSRILETFKIKREFGPKAPDYTEMLANVASNEIQLCVEELRANSVEDVATISSRLHVATYHKAYGLHLSELG